MRGDRLQWSDREGMHDVIVEQVNHFAGPATIDHLVLRPVAIAGRNNETLSLFRDDVARLAGNASCRRLEWPDERVRQRELARQYAFRGRDLEPRLRWTCRRGRPDTLDDGAGPARRYASGRGRRREHRRECALPPAWIR